VVYSVKALWAMSDGTFCLAVGGMANDIVGRLRERRLHPKAPFTVVGHMATINVEHRSDGRPARQFLFDRIEL
jgi:hypothetical protein